MCVVIDGIDISSLITAVPVIGVLIAWLASARNQVQDLQDRYDRLDAEYKASLKERQQQILNERFLGVKLSSGDGNA